MKDVFRFTGLVGLVVAIGLMLGAPQASAIVGGSPDNGAHPMVGVLFADDRVPVVLGGVGIWCSGTLIAPHEFLTAAHCTSVLTEARRAHFRVSFDEQLALSPAGLVIAQHSVGVTGWTTHPDYRKPATAWDPGANDVGLIHLDPNVDLGIGAVDLPEVGFLDTAAAKGGLQGHEFDIVGYGLNGLDRAFLSPQANISWAPKRMFSTALFKALTPNNLMQFGGTCIGDSGGPHFYGGAAPNLEVAVTSGGDPTCGAEDSSQRLDTQAVHDFLEPFTH